MHLSEQEHSGHEPSIREEAAQPLNTRLRVVLSIVIDALMLLLILPILAFMEWVRARLQLHGLNAWFLTATEVVLTIATFITIVFYVYLDLRRLFRRYRDDN